MAERGRDQHRPLRVQGVDRNVEKGSSGSAWGGVGTPDPDRAGHGLGQKPGSIQAPIGLVLT